MAPAQVKTASVMSCPPMSMSRPALAGRTVAARSAVHLARSRPAGPAPGSGLPAGPAAVLAVGVRQTTLSVSPSASASMESPKWHSSMPRFHAAQGVGHGKSGAVTRSVLARA
jgi:hypothetical protein